MNLANEITPKFKREQYTRIIRKYLENIINENLKLIEISVLH